MTLAIDITFESHGTYVTYMVALFASGILMLVLAATGLGASIGPRLFSGVGGLLFLGYATWAAFIRPREGVFEMQPVVFIVPVLMIGYILYSRSMNREIDAELLAERAKRKAQRAVESDGGTDGTAAS